MTTSTRNFLAASNAYNFAIDMMNTYAAHNDFFNREVWFFFAERALVLMKKNLNA